MVRMPTKDTNPDHKGGGGINKAGDYHFLVEKYEDYSQSDKPRLEFQLLVIGGKEADQIGKKHTETMWLTGQDEKKTASAQNRVMEFGCALGLYSKQQWRADVEAGQEADIPFEQSEGRQFCAPIELRPYKGDKPEHQGKSFANLGFKFWAVGDEEADHVLKDQDYVGLFGPAGSPLPTREGPARVPGTKSASGGNGHGHKPVPSTHATATRQPASQQAAAATGGFGDNF